jgi:hypothetical protein
MPTTPNLAITSANSSNLLLYHPKISLSYFIELANLKITSKNTYLEATNYAPKQSKIITAHHYSAKMAFALNITNVGNAEYNILCLVYLNNRFVYLRNSTFI